MYSAGDVAKVALNDEDRVSQSGTQEYMIHEFKDFVGSNSQCTLEWEGRSTLAPSSSIVKLQIFNQQTNAWIDVDTDNESIANFDFTLTNSIADLTNYKNPSNVISCRVYQEAL